MAGHSAAASVGGRTEEAGAAWLRADTVVVAHGVILRGPVVALAPVLGQIRQDLEVSSAVVGLLVTLPVLCFGLGTAGASRLIARLGVRRALDVAVAVIAGGLLLRVAGGAAAAIAGTVLLGLAITVANVAVPVVTQTRGGAGQRVTTWYVVVMNLFSLVATVMTAPVAAAVGWRAAVTVPWVVVAACLAWLLRLRRVRTELPGHVPPPVRGALVADRRATAVALLLMTGFAGQTFGYYAITSWLPTQLEQVLGASLVGAGLSAALFQAGGVIGPFAIGPALRHWRVTTVFLVIGALWMLYPVGMLLLPHLWWSWGLAAGVAQGATFTLVLSLVAAVSPDQHRARQTSALVQGGGYAAGAIGPVALAAAHELSGAWTVPMLIVLAAVLMLAVAGTAAALLVRRDVEHLREKAVMPAEGGDSR